MKEVQVLLDRSFDNKFSYAKTNGLTWLPWIGKNYSSANRKFIILGESHYFGEKENEKRQLLLEKCIKNENFTREIVYECPITRQWSNRTFENLHRTLLKTDHFEGEKLWENIAFYNFIQRPMNSLKERPTNDDFSAGWRPFVDVIKILKPDDCLFVGVTAANTFNTAMATLGIKHSPISIIGFFNGAYLRCASITIAGKETRILFIRHTSQYFSWSIWHEQLAKNFRDTLLFLKKTVAPNSVDEEIITFPASERYYTNEIPTWLSHKPIIACSYPEQTEITDEDAKYISAGRAQYNRKCASVKVFRYAENGQRWSRQSEEVPIHRMAYMMELFLAAIIHTQQTGEDSFQSAAHEEIVSPEDVDFLRNELNRNRHAITDGLTRVRDLLTKIDLNKI